MRSAFRTATEINALRHTAWLRAVKERAEEQAHRRFDDRRKRETAERDADERDFLQFVVVALASGAELSRFEADLSIHDAATIEALQANAEDLAEARNAREEILDMAHTMPDGRRVFGTADGLKVYDEHGQRVSDDVVSPNDIDDARPTWEQFAAADQAYMTLRMEREELLAYQERLDEVRDRVDRGEITKAELTEFEELLEDQAPARVPALVEARDPELARTKTNTDHSQGVSHMPAGPELDLSL